MSHLDDRRTIAGVHFIRVRGSGIERARAHGILLKQEIHEGALKALAKKNEWLIRRSPGKITQLKLVQDSALWFYNKVLLPYLNRSENDNKKMMRAMAEVTGLPFELIRASTYQPDGLMFLSRISVMQYFFKDLPQSGLPACSSSVVLRDWTKSKKLMACRNLDYPLVGEWEKHPTVVFNEPTGAGLIPYVAVTTAGVQTGGLTSMNSEGLTLSVHAHFGKHVSFNGQPIIAIGEEIISKAKTINEAVDIAKKNQTHASWTFVVSSGKENDAVAIEMTPKKVIARHAEDGILVHTNYFHSKELQRDEAVISGACNEDLFSRVCRMREILSSLRGKIEVSDLVETLADHMDPLTGEERVVGNTISVVTTVKSVVFEPEDLKFWISSRRESPTSDGEFLEVDTQKFWNADLDDTTIRRAVRKKPQNPALMKSMTHFREAYRHWHMKNDKPDYAEKTYAELKNAVKEYPSDGNLWIQSGILAFFLHRFEEAQHHFLQAKSRKLSMFVTQVCNLYLARCYDLFGERKRALEFYASEAQVENPKLKKAYKKGIRRPYHQSETLSMMIDLQFADTLQY